MLDHAGIKDRANREVVATEEPETEGKQHYRFRTTGCRQAAL